MLAEVICVPEPVVIDEKKRRKTLTDKRNLLFGQYLKNPGDTRLALEIKLIDDQIADSIAQTERKPGIRK